MAITKRKLFAILLMASLPASALAEGHGHSRYAWGGRADLEGSAGADPSARWEARAWIGDDRDRLLLRSEGEHADGASAAETWALASHNISTFWDVQAGLRKDSGPDGASYAVLGLEGLAPYFFDSEAHALVADDGDVSLRLHQSVDVLLTQKLVLQPRLEINAGLGRATDRALGSGLRDSEFGLRLRYELAREFAPYVEWRRERRHGETADLQRAAGETTGDSGWHLGLALRF